MSWPISTFDVNPKKKKINKKKIRITKNNLKEVFFWEQKRVSRLLFSSPNLILLPNVSFFFYWRQKKKKKKKLQNKLIEKVEHSFLRQCPFGIKSNVISKTDIKILNFSWSKKKRRKPIRLWSLFSASASYFWMPILPCAKDFHKNHLLKFNSNSIYSVSLCVPKRWQNGSNPFVHSMACKMFL